MTINGKCVDGWLRKEEIFFYCVLPTWKNTHTHTCTESFQYILHIFIISKTSYLVRPFGRHTHEKAHELNAKGWSIRNQYEKDVCWYIRDNNNSGGSNNTTTKQQNDRVLWIKATTTNHTFIHIIHTFAQIRDTNTHTHASVVIELMPNMHMLFNFYSRFFGMMLPNLVKWNQSHPPR